jgi:PAS domain S-box-containing protein
MDAIPEMFALTANAAEHVALAVAAVVVIGMAVAWRQSTRRKATELANRFTEGLREQEHALAESEYRWKFAVEGTGDGLWDWNVVDGSTFYSHRWKEMLGFADEEISGDPDEFELRLHPDEKEEVLVAMDECLIGASPLLELEHRVRHRDGHYIWILDRGMVVDRAPDGTALRMIGTHRDITERHDSRGRIAQLTRMYRALSACSAAIVRCNDESELYAEICRVVVEDGGMQMAWIGLVEPTTGRIAPVEWFGTGGDYLDGIEISAHAEDPHGRGPTGAAIRENRAKWIDDFAVNPRTEPWRERGSRFGWVASAALPIRRGGTPMGALTFYSGRKGWFDDETRALLEEMADDISYAVDKFTLEADAMGHAATLVESEQRFQSLVEQSIAGAFIVQHGVFVYVNPRCKEILGYTEDDDLTGHTLEESLHPQDLQLADDQWAMMMAGGPDHIEASYRLIRKDGTSVEVAANTSLSTYHGEPAVIGFVQDLSDRKVAEDRIQRYAAQLQRTFMQTVALVTALGEMRDPYTAGHEERVAELAIAIGREMDLSPDQIEGLRVSGHLHDVGKIRVPAEILVKPSGLSALETAMLREHPATGYDILKGVDFPWPVAQVALQHHERMDGSGYPNGLKGDEILLEARIVMVADVVESMSSHRPYRAALGVDAALYEIERGAGTLYDADVVAACLRHFRQPVS